MKALSGAVMEALRQACLPEFLNRIDETIIIQAPGDGEIGADR